jgi:TatD DNase family protein
LYFNLHTHIIDNQLDKLSILNLYPNENIPEKSYFSTGIHPWFINEDWENELEIISKNLQHSKCLALGECGLDKRIEIPLELQIQVFENQVFIAKSMNKPLILHCVAAFDEILKVLNDQKFSNHVIFHGFSKNQNIANQLLKKGYYLSFGKYLMSNKEVCNVFKNIDNKYFFLENDNSNFSIQEIYKKASEIKNITENEMKVIVNQNFNHVFKLYQTHL